MQRPGPELKLGLDLTLQAADPERAQWAPASALPLTGIKLTPDKSLAYLAAETEIKTPLSLAAGGGTETMVAGAGFTYFRLRVALKKSG